ncbi:hypothetical protein DGo_PD0013 (plasmid) [Deinococcus gobiensis I-0]|uniref:Uncharacterized protein n=1 Tax=Deinococcus gobiensis (strain DSM 21396 / JCM 16679 / CGMCC 1.7299 / I-0) TaxID=745776 RepID=H8H3J0_DEIGI|nr:hypothetical protein DGo_PD0013 [Deinococcus gobiensis I-0]
MALLMRRVWCESLSGPRQPGRTARQLYDFDLAGLDATFQ